MAKTQIDPTEAGVLHVPWTAEDAANLRAFFGTVSGKRAAGKMLLERPPVSERSDPFKRGIQSAILEGYEEAFRKLTDLTDSTRSVDRPKPNPQQA